MTREEALKIRAQVEAGAAALPDIEASVEPTLSRTMRYDGGLIPAGTRINWGGVLKRAAVDIWDTKENTPDVATDLWEDVLYRDGIRIIPEVITAGLAFSYDELGWWGDVVQRSILPGEKTNVYTPDEYPSAWEVVE
jgi:hypothetical protein